MEERKKSIRCVEIATWSPNEMKKKKRKSQSNIGYNRITEKNDKRCHIGGKIRAPSTWLELYWLK